MEISLISFLTGLLALALFFIFVALLSKKKHEPQPPTAPGAWPVIGHILLFAGGAELPHVTLGALADKCGPIFTIRLGMHRAVVVSSWEVAKECYTTHDAMFSRPRFAAAKHLAYDYAMFSLSPEVAYWRELRKMASSELLSARRLELLKHVRVSEIEMGIKDLCDRSSGGCVLVDLQEYFSNMSLNIILRMVAGKRYNMNSSDKSDEKDQWQNGVKEFFELLALSVPSDVFPILECLDIGGKIKKMKRAAKDLDSILGKWLDEHRRKKVSGDDDQQDFMDVMISEIGSKEVLAGYDVDTIIKATCLAIIAGATDTTTVTLIWAISLLLNNPHTFKKAQQELHTIIGPERLPNESDIENLPYLQAIVKETLRLYPPAPLASPREFTKDCIVSGYHIPKGTRLIPNLWKIQNDPRLWPEPFEFKPERFLTTHKDIDFRGKHFELIPFGSGRRGCPGMNFGLQVVHLALASFLHAFEVSTPENVKVDMTASFGITNMKATPLETLVKPRINVLGK